MAQPPPKVLGTPQWLPEAYSSQAKYKVPTNMFVFLTCSLTKVNKWLSESSQTLAASPTLRPAQR